MGLRMVGGQHAADRCGHPFPVLRFFGKLFSSGLGELIELRLAVVLGVAPLGVDQPLLLEPVQRRVERALVDLQDVFGNLVDPQCDAPPVHGDRGQCLEDQEVERPLE